MPQQRVDSEKILSFLEALVSKIQKVKVYGWYTFDLILQEDGEVPTPNYKSILTDI
jgi:hypothetical protein